MPLIGALPINCEETSCEFIGRSVVPARCQVNYSLVKAARFYDASLCDAWLRQKRAPLVFNIIEFFYFEMPGLGLRERVDTDTPG
jgi:hypothetical protein